ncbi:MAG: hypothetical protein AAGA99_26275 [Actinomycetota bacterium]
MIYDVQWVRRQHPDHQQQVRDWCSTHRYERAVAIDLGSNAVEQNVIDDDGRVRSTRGANGRIEVVTEVVPLTLAAATEFAGIVDLVEGRA